MAGETSDARLAAVAEDLERLVRRLRSLSPRALRDRREAVRDALADLAALSSRLEARRIEPPEVVADHVLADAIAVVGRDVVEAAADRADAATLAAAHKIVEATLLRTR